MANVENRAAEHGGHIIADTLEHSFSPGKPVVVIRVLTDTVIDTIESPNMEGLAAYYEGLALTEVSKDILANVTRLQLTSGVVQVIYS